MELRWPRYRPKFQAKGFSSRYELCTGTWREVQHRASKRTSTDVRSEVEIRRDALLRVKAGAAAGERDSVILPEAEFQFPVLASILRAAMGSKRGINILDFGGSLGSVYFQYKSFIDANLNQHGGELNLRWNIVELPEYVDCGRKCFENDELKFWYSIDQCILHTSPNIVLLSGVLQALESPYTILRQLGEIGANTLIIDRTACSESDQDLIALQIATDHSRGVHMEWPFWIFSSSRLASELCARWRVISTFSSVVDAVHRIEGITVYPRGYLCDRRQ